MLSGNGPTIVGNVRTGTTYNNIEPRWAIGNLDGLYGYSGSTYGVAMGVPSGAWVKIDPTNGVRIGYNTTVNAQINASGAASFAAGSALIDSTGVSLDISATSAPALAQSYWFNSGANTIMALQGYQTGGLYAIRLWDQWSAAGTATMNIEMAASGINTRADNATVTCAANGTVGNSAVTLSIGTANTNFQVLQGGIKWGNPSYGQIISTSDDVAVLSVNNIFAGVIEVRNTGPVIQTKYTSGSSDEKYTRFVSTGHTFVLDLANDAYSAANPVFTVTRSGYTLSTIIRGDNSPSWDIVSDVNAKTDITPFTGATDLMRAVAIKSFDYNGQFDVKPGPSIGPIAQEVQAIFPRSVKTATMKDGTSYLTFNPSEMFMANVAFTQSIDAHVQTLEARIVQLEAQVVKLTGA